jgi:hypothetical protein
MLLFGHRQLEAVGKRFFVLADECGQTLKQMKVSATIGHPARGHFLHVGVVVLFCNSLQ